MKSNCQKGQIGLLLLVVMGVVFALVMSVASRSLSDTVVSRQEQESSAAFAVAETGIEKALNELRLGTSTTATVNYSASFGEGSYKIENPTTLSLYVKELETAQLELSVYVPTLIISWTKKSDVTENLLGCTEGSGNAPAALEVSAIAATTISRTYYNPRGCNPGSNGFLSTAVNGGSVYRSQVTYSVPAGTTIVRVKPIYSGATISIPVPGVEAQLYVIKSRAVGGDAQKEIEVKRGLDAPPSIFDFALFSAGSIVK